MSAQESTILLPEEISNSLILKSNSPIIAKAGVGDKMIVEGWASTIDQDREGDVVLSTAFDKYLDKYRKAGRYWFNHDRKCPIGRVNKVSVSTNGLYIDEAVLSETSWNKEFLWPHIKSGAISEHSIQFLSHSPYKDKTKAANLIHREIEVIETSIVSFACNPAAVITGFKGLLPEELRDSSDLITLPQLYTLFSDGHVALPSEVVKKFFVEKSFSDQTIENETQDNNKMSANTEQSQEEKSFSISDFSTVVNTDISLDALKIPDAQFKSANYPKTVASNYEAVANSTHLARFSNKKTFILPVADISENGEAYVSFEKMATSLGSLLGIKGGYVMDDSVKLEAFSKLSQLYKLLAKNEPTHEDVPLSQLDESVLLNLKFKDVVFNEKEDEIILSKEFINNINKASNVLESSKEKLTDEALTVFKEAYAYWSISFYGYSAEDTDFFASLLSLYREYKNRNSDEDLSDSYMYEGSLDDSKLKEFSNFLEKIQKNSTEEQTPEEKEDNNDNEEESSLEKTAYDADALKKTLSELNSLFIK